MLEVAEALFAARGVEGVSTRDIAAAAGQRNTSAVNYHFGSRDGLLLEVFRYRMADFDRIRFERLRELDERGHGDDVRALVEAWLRPLADHVEHAPVGGHYARFIARIGPTLGAAKLELINGTQATTEMTERLIGSLDHLSRPIALHRIHLVFGLAVTAFAMYEQHRADGYANGIEFPDMVRQVTDMAVGALEAADSSRADGAPDVFDP